MRLSRGSLLAGTGGLQALLFSGEMQPGRQTPSMASVDVVVVSAGLSGLIAARELPKKGKIVAVLEAKGRTGGRMVNQKVAGDGVIDLGSQWGETHYRLEALSDELNGQVYSEWKLIHI
ncbi:MAG: FAD-dependent oxidoreductase [Cyanobacteriota bacterium]|nr:FAD-dependent oxidoreductase [Cyanobacteriota bacterium]